MANWTVSTLYGRLEELIEELELKETSTIKEMRAGLRDLIVEEALAGANRKRRGGVKATVESKEVPGQVSVDEALSGADVIGDTY
jgi:hypothetical protein